jgi:hypothetical protein
MSDEIQETTQEKNNKIEKKFAVALTKLTAVVQGEKNLKIPKKIPGDALGSLVADLFKEENETLVKNVREELRDLLKKYAEMNAAFKAKQEELDKLQKQKKEEFTKAAEALFGKIDNVGKVEQSYYQGLKDALTPDASKETLIDLKDV